MPSAVVLLSGGMDSAVCAAIALERGFAVHALSVDYGQRHRAELDAAARVSASLKLASHRVVRMDLRAIGGSALTADIAVPIDRTDAQMSAGIPVTYVPARNTVMLAIALGLAETLGAFDLFAGVNALDQPGYPDCRPEFVRAFADLANLATAAAVEGKGRFQVHTPLIQMTKATIVREGRRLGVDLSLTHSCYRPDENGAPCGRCDACVLRARGFAEADG